MKICKNCGKQLKDTAKFCYFCGNKADEEIKRFCDDCGAEITGEMTFCPECGKHVSDVSAYTDADAAGRSAETAQSDPHFVPISASVEISTPPTTEKILPGFNYSVTSSGRYVIVSMWDKFLTEVDIPSSVEVIGPKAFEGSRLINVTLHEGLRMIDDRAFADCKLLTSIAIPDSVNFIGNEVFLNCEKLDITIPDSVSHIGENAVLNTLSDNRIKAEIEAKRVAAANIFKYVQNEQGDVTVVGLNDESVTKVVIPDKDAEMRPVTGIGERAFFKNKNLVEIVVPECVTAVGKDAFAGCKNLVVKISKNAKFGKNAFGGCKEVITF